MELIEKLWYSTIPWRKRTPPREDCAVDRCPVEIWTLIIRWAACAPPWNNVLSSFQDLRFYRRSNGVEQESDWEASEASTERLCAFALVCRTWRSIVHPLLLERVVLSRATGARAVAFLLSHTFKGRSNASYVKRLVISLGGDDTLAPTDSMDYSFWLGNEAPDLIELLKHCTSLQEFIWDADLMESPSRLLETLGVFCGKTLTTLDAGLEPQDLQAVIWLITQCPRLKVFICRPRWRKESLSALQLPVESPSDEPLALDTLFTSSGDWQCLPWATLLLSPTFSLSHLRYLSINLDLLPEESADDLSTPFRIFMEMCAPSLRFLEITGFGLRHRTDSGRTLQIFNLCPNLEETIFTLPDMEVNINLAPHPALRSVGFHFLPLVKADYTPMMPTYFQTMTALVTALLSPNFPKLESVRCMQDPCFLTHEEFEHALSYRHRVKELARMFEGGRVRFENIEGLPFGLAFEEAIESCPRGSR